jgi:dihydroorotate dehydrogenase (NAD+) catalytic subunit
MMQGLTTHIGKFEMTSPVMTASGTFGYGQEYADFVDFARLGAVVVKSVSLKPRIGNKPQRLFETPSGMLNSIGLQNVGLDEFLEKKLPVLREYPTRVVVNIAGRTEEEYIEVAARLEGIPGIDALELNLSCPNVKEGAIAFGQSGPAIESVVGKVRARTKAPLWVKLSPNVSDSATLAKAAESAGADAICAINTLHGIGIDAAKRRAQLGNIAGGLSGPAIKPVALYHVWKIYEAVDIPVIGIGGICNAEDVIEFILAGATAVQVGSVNFRDPDVTMTIMDGLEEYVRCEGLGNIGDIRGAVWN